MTSRLATFVTAVEFALAECREESALLDRVQDAMRVLVGTDDWLPPALARPHPVYYQQYLVHCDAARRFSVVSFVWGPGQQTPIHDHKVWGVIGMLRGAELAQGYRLTGQGLRPEGAEHRLDAGEVAAVSPRVGDIHRVRNAHADRVSISIHVYGTDIGRQSRHAFDPATGAAKEFVSGYSNAQELPL